MSLDIRGNRGIDCTLVKLDEYVGRGRTGGVGNFFRLNDWESSFVRGSR